MQAFWQSISELVALDEQQRLAAIEQGWSSSWLVALRQHLHLKPAELEPLIALSEATMARRCREGSTLDLVASERLDRLMEVISLASGVFEQPASTKAWLKAPHPLLHQASAGAGAAFRGGTPGPQPAAQSTAPGHGAGGAGSSGDLPAGSAVGLSCASATDHRSHTPPHLVSPPQNS